MPENKLKGIREKVEYLVRIGINEINPMLADPQMVFNCNSTAVEDRRYLLELVGRMREGLEKLEWSSSVYDGDTWVAGCPVCEAQKLDEVHESHCWLDALLREMEGEMTEQVSKERQEEWDRALAAVEAEIIENLNTDVELERIRNAKIAEIANTKALD